MLERLHELVVCLWFELLQHFTHFFLSYIMPSLSRRLGSVHETISKRVHKLVYLYEGRGWT